MNRDEWIIESHDGKQYSVVVQSEDNILVFAEMSENNLHWKDEELLVSWLFETNAQDGDVISELWYDIDSIFTVISKKG